MKFESKYEVGQKLWEIKLELKWTGEACEHCGRIIYADNRWVLDDCEQEIHGINMQGGSIYYKVWRPCVYREMLPESDIGRTYFTTREEALAEVERLNAALRQEANDNA